MAIIRWISRYSSSVPKIFCQKQGEIRQKILFYVLKLSGWKQQLGIMLLSMPLEFVYVYDGEKYTRSKNTEVFNTACHCNPAAVELLAQLIVMVDHNVWPTEGFVLFTRT